MMAARLNKTLLIAWAVHSIGRRDVTNLRHIGRTIFSYNALTLWADEPEILSSLAANRFRVAALV
jgi:hypothetical protein